MANTLYPSTSLHIGGITIHQDENGRFSLNDLHQAAGGEERYRPSRFARTDAFKSIVAALEEEHTKNTDADHNADDCLKIERRPEMAFGPIPADPVHVIKGGPNQGTYVARELVYAYAMWISPAFNLKVIRTFDALMMGRIQAVREDARLAIEARDNQLFIKTAKWKEEVAHRDAGEVLIRKVRSETDPLLRRHHFNTLTSLYRRLGDEPPIYTELDAPTPLLGHAHSEEGGAA